LFVHGDAVISDLWMLGLLIPASSLLYVGGVVLNDVVDHRLDAVERPNRPLPAGRVTVKAASVFCGILLTLGVLCGWIVSFGAGKWLPGVTASALLACILLYNIVLKNTPLGPVAMGACRMLNVLLGMSVLGEMFPSSCWLVAGGIGLYITGVTWFARTEAARSKRLPLAAAAIVMMAGIALIAWAPQWIERDWLGDSKQWYAIMAVMAAMIGWRCLVAIAKPESIWVQRAVGHAVLSLIMLDASACFVIRGPYLAAAILMLMLPAMFISRRISPT
jgi:4-hydroxybenzoate polyprenyltransferase